MLFRLAVVVSLIFVTSTAFAQLEPEGPKFDFSALDLPPQSEAIVLSPALPLADTGWAFTENTLRAWIRPGPRTMTSEKLARALESRIEDQIAVRDSKIPKLWRITDKLEKALFEQPRSLLVGVEEINRRHVWYHRLSRTIDLERYPILVMTYRGTNVSNRVGYTIFIGDTGGPNGGYFGFPTSYIKDDGEIQQASHDMRRPMEGITKGPLTSVAVGLRVDEFYGPGRLEILDLRFMRAEDSPPAVTVNLGKPLAVKVTDQQKQPVEGARVTVDPEFLTFARSGITNADGLVVITPYENSMYTIVVEKKGMVPQVIRQMPYSSNVVSFQLTPAAACSGQIVDEWGNPVADAAVVCQPNRGNSGFRQNQTVPAQTLMQSSALTDENGRWRCSDVDASEGNVLIQVSHNNYAFPPDELVAVEALRDGRHVTVVGEGISFEVVVRDEAGRAVERAELVLQTPGTSSSATTDAEGRYKFSRVSPGEKTLAISAPTYLTQSLRVNAQPDMPRVEVGLKQGYVVRLLIVNKKDRPVQGAYINANIAGSSGHPWMSRSDNEGRVVWKEAPEGEIVFSISAQGYMYTSARVRSDGEEHVVKLGTTSKITGSVVDDATGKPIPQFRVMEGLVWQAGQTPTWQRSPNEGRDGRYEITTRQSIPFRAVMVEAEGYLPAISETFTGDKEDPVVDFRLKKGKPLAGRVLNPDGKPVAGAKVAAVAPGMNVHIDSNGINTDVPTSLTDADGRYELPPRVGVFILVAIGDAGYAQIKVADPAALPDVTLQAWGRVRGRYLIGDKPAETQIVLHPVEFSNSQQIYWNFQTSTDANGVFEFERIPPGCFSVSNIVRIGDSMRSSGQNKYAEVTAGNGVEVQLGGAGRPVLGKIKNVPAGGFVRGSINSTMRMPSQPRPENFGQMPPELQQRWRETWLETPEGQAYQKQVMEVRMNSFATSFSVGADGSFRADDIPEGTYNLSISWQSADYNQYKSLAQHNFTVPLIPGGRSDEPLDLGEIAELPGR